MAIDQLKAIKKLTNQYDEKLIWNTFIYKLSSIFI